MSCIKDKLRYCGSSSWVIKKVPQGLLEAGEPSLSRGEVGKGNRGGDQ